MLTTSRDTVLSLESVTIDFGRQRAVESITFTVGRGERCVIMGRSGCGKTTLLKAVGGYVKPTEGTILLNGNLIKKPGPDRMVVWQDLDQLLPWKTVEQNVSYPLIMKGIKRQEASSTARAWLDRVGLGHSFEKYPHELSGGMKQRVAIARGFAARPDLLLLDEPFSALDALTRHKLQDELISLQEKFPVTVLFVSHDVNEAVRIGTQIIVLSPGPGHVIAQFTANTSQLEEKILARIYEDVKVIE